MCRHIWWLFKLWILASHGLFEMFTSCFVFLKTYFNKITCLLGGTTYRSMATYIPTCCTFGIMSYRCLDMIIFVTLKWCWLFMKRWHYFWTVFKASVLFIFCFFAKVVAAGFKLTTFHSPKLLRPKLIKPHKISKDFCNFVKMAKLLLICSHC